MTQAQRKDSINRDEVHFQRDKCLDLKEIHKRMDRLVEEINDNPEFDSCINIVLLESLCDIVGEMIKDSER